jgi:pimeloyl-ACP methyl ester carboxylesterase
MGMAKNNEDASTAVTVKLQFKGKKRTDKPAPEFLRAGLRSADGAADAFLPESYVRIDEVYDLSAGMRAAEGVGACSVSAKPGTVIVMELADGTTVITGAERLQQSLAHGGAAATQAAINLERLGETASSRGMVADAVSAVVSRVFTLTVGESADAIIEDARRKLAEWLGIKAESVADLGVTWLGTKALMWAVEKRLAREPGLYRWGTAQGDLTELGSISAEQLAEAVKAGPLLVFVHGTASSTTGSFGDLRGLAREQWTQLEARFPGGIYAYEHRTFSESPIRNAVDLARCLPSAAQINLVSHSRGGLVADLLCLDYLDDVLIQQYQVKPNAVGASDPAERKRVVDEAAKAYAEHRNDLQELRAELTKKRFVIQRYVRVACPARGTRLVSGNLDLFLSGLLTLIGRVPYLAGNPIYSAIKRIVIEIAKNRTNPMLVPGIEAMLPESPMGRLLAQAKPHSGIRMAVITGDIDTTDANFLKKLGVLFTDYMFFNGIENDLVVDTDSMYAGIAIKSQALARFDAGARVSHFRYFENLGTRRALHDWLVLPDVKAVEGFEQAQDQLDEAHRKKLKDRLLAAVTRTRGGPRDDPSLPVVVVLPGIMGTHLWVNRKDRVWLDPADLAFGGLTGVAWGAKNVEAEELFDRFYGDLCEYLVATHRVEPFPYDWRLPLDELGKRLGLFLKKLLAETGTRPLRLLAHSMGGLVVRSLIYQEPMLVEELMLRSGSRLVTLGTPHQGSHSMVETLLGKADAIRTLARVDLGHDLQEVLDIVAGFRGALQLLPRTGFKDTGTDTKSTDYFKPQVWSDFKKEVRDFWFGDGVTGVPEAIALKEGQWLWDQDNEHAGAGSLPSIWPKELYNSFLCWKPIRSMSTAWVPGHPAVLSKPTDSGNCSAPNKVMAR